MRKLLLNLGLFLAVVLLAIAFVRWGGEQTRGAARTRATVAYYVIGFVALIACWITIQNRRYK